MNLEGKCLSLEKYTESGNSERQMFHILSQMLFLASDLKAPMKSRQLERGTFRGFVERG